MLSWNTNKITEMDEVEPNVPWQRKTGKRIFDYFVADGVCDGNVGGWNVFLFNQWASDPNLIPTSHQDAIDHPENILTILQQAKDNLWEQRYLKI